LWSLAVEEQFYLVWPAIIAWTPRRRLPALCLAVIVAAVALRVVLLHQGAGLAAYVLTPARADTLAVGAVLAIALRSGPRARDAVARAAPTIGVITAAVLGALFVTHRLDHRLTVGGLVLGSVAAPLATAACIGRIGSKGWIRRALEWGPLVSFGTYSYAIYLVQLPLRGGIDYWLSGQLAAWPAMLGVGIETVLLGGGSWCIAWVSWRLVERPILSLKKYVPMPSAATALRPADTMSIFGWVVRRHSRTQLPGDGYAAHECDPLDDPRPAGPVLPFCRQHEAADSGRDAGPAV
jgi:peptidoglycan/LPS O-acetylase OafA/YrhL